MTAPTIERPAVTSDNRLTRAETAHRLGVTERTVDRYASDGTLTPRRNPRTRRTTFDTTEVDRVRATRENL